MTWAALGTASSAFIADLMPPEQRGWGMWAFINAPRRWAGYWGAALIGGLLADSVGFKPMLLSGTVLAALGIPFVLLYLKEPRQAPK
jgi:MFS family permease